MDFGAFSIISIIYVIIGVRIVADLIRNWAKVWDGNFTTHDRHLVDQAAFFVLIPVSVLLHELGHAVAVWGFGKEVVEVGFYGFAGYVAYYPQGLSDVQQTLISAAGSLVNLLLCAGVFAFVFLKRPPLRAPVNELLIQFAFISGLNAFIVYPLLDVLSGLNGDWRQMYDSGVPWLSATIAGVQLAVLVAGYWLATNPAVKARFSALTAVPPGYERGFLGGIQPGKVAATAYSPAERTLYDAVERVTSGWPNRVTTNLQRFPAGSAVTMQWSDGSRTHMVAARAFATGITDLVHFPDGEGGRPPSMLHRWPALPDTDALTMALRVAMESVQANG
jgi:hypothetical protein